MKTFSEILKKSGINDLKTLKNFLKTGIGSELITIITKDNYKEFLDKNLKNRSLIIENMVIDIEEIDFSAIEKIKINNTIFTGRVILFQNKTDDNVIIEAEIENTIFLKELIVNHCFNKKTNLYFYNSNFAYLGLININPENIVINHCKIFMFYIENIKVGNFETENNKISYMDIKEYEFKKITFDYKQLSENIIDKRMKKKFSKIEMKNYLQLEFDINLFEFIKFYKKSDLQERVHQNSIENLIRFIKEESNISKNKEEMNKLLFWESFFLQKRVGARIFIWVSRAFFYPGRFLIIGAILFLIFALIYTLPVMLFTTGGVTKTINFAEALYFSGVTFTTLGYGDISAVGIARAAAVTEAVMGIVTMNTFMVALIKKYVD